MKEDVLKAYLLIDKQFSELASPIEMEELKHWRSESEENDSIYHDILRILRIVTHLKEWRTFNKRKAWHAFEKSVGIKRFPWKIFSIVAASLVLVFSIFTFDNEKPGTIFNRSTIYGSEINYTFLDDGTELFMEEDAIITYAPFNIDERVVYSSGSYFVNVQRDINRPFKIKTEDFSIDVLGTSFMIEEGEESSVISVREGKVRICLTNGMCYTIYGNEQCNISNGEVKINSANGFDWGLNSREYEDYPVISILNTLDEKYQNVEFPSSDRIENCRVTTIFNNSTALEIIEELSLLLNIQYQLEDGKIKIQKISC